MFSSTVTNASDVDLLDSSWVKSKKFNSEGRIVDINGKAVGTDFRGIQYKLTEKRERAYTPLERIFRAYLGVQVLTMSLGFALFSKKVRHLFTCEAEKKRYGINAEEEIIRDFVARFLHPYITNQITRETESANRKPMMELLLDQMKETNLSHAEIEKRALEAYIKNAIIGLGVYQREIGIAHAVLERPLYDILVDSLWDGISKDFPALILSKEELGNITKQYFDLFCQKLQEDKEEQYRQQEREKMARRSICLSSGCYEEFPQQPSWNDVHTGIFQHITKNLEKDPNALFLV